MAITSYVGPGVYVTQQPTPQFGALPTGPRVLGVVGTGHTYLPVTDTPIVKGAANGSDAIPLGTYSFVSVAFVGDTPATKQYIQNTDFVLVGSSIAWLSNGKQPTTGATYYVTWNRAKVSPQDYQPIFFINGQMQSIRNAYGNELENGIYNVIPVAANLAFQNGAAAIIISQALSASQTDLQTAIDNMKAKINKLAEVSDPAPDDLDAEVEASKVDVAEQ